MWTDIVDTMHSQMEWFLYSICSCQWGMALFVVVVVFEMMMRLVPTNTFSGGLCEHGHTALTRVPRHVQINNQNNIWSFILFRWFVWLMSVYCQITIFESKSESDSLHHGYWMHRLKFETLLDLGHSNFIKYVYVFNAKLFYYQHTSWYDNRANNSGHLTF